MRVTINNYATITEQYEGLTGLKKFKAGRSISASMGNEKIPTSLKIISDMGSISFGHFIITEKILTHEKMEHPEKFKMILPYLLRPIKEEYLDNSDQKKEDAHVSNVLNIDIGVCNKVFEDYLALRDGYLYKTFNGVIYAPKEEEETEEDKEDEDINEGGGQSARAFHYKKFFWIDLIMLIANGDVFREQEVVELPMHRVMVHFAKKRSLEIVETLEAKARR